MSIVCHGFNSMAGLSFFMIRSRVIPLKARFFFLNETLPARVSHIKSPAEKLLGRKIDPGVLQAQ